MALTSGRAGKLAVSAAGVTYTDVGDITNIEYNESHETEDKTTFDSAGYKESGYGETQATLSVTFRRDESDAGQDIIRTSNEAKSAIYYRVRMYENSGANQKTFQGKINGLSNTNARNEVVEQKLDVESTGTITSNTQ